MKKLIMLFVATITIIGFQSTSFASVLPETDYLIGADELLYEHNVDLVNSQLKLLHDQTGMALYFVVRSDQSPNSSLSNTEYLNEVYDTYELEKNSSDAIAILFDVVDTEAITMTFGAKAEAISTDLFNEMVYAYDVQETFVGGFHAAMMVYTQSLDEYITVYDGAQLLSNSEESELRAMISDIKATYDFDVTIATVDSIGEADILNFGYDYIMMDESADGVVFVINMDEEHGGANRGYTTATRNSGINIFSEAALDNIDYYVPSYLTDGEYYLGCVEYLELTTKFLSADASGDVYSSTPINTEEITWIFAPAAILGIACSYFVSKAFVNSMNTAVIKVEAQNYVRKNSFNLNINRDTFLHTHTSRTPRSKGGSSGGGSSSSGGSRGGRSGGF